jgi:hypothetical protein
MLLLSCVQPFAYLFIEYTDNLGCDFTHLTWLDTSYKAPNYAWLDYKKYIGTDMTLSG